MQSARLDVRAAVEKDAPVRRVEDAKSLQADMVGLAEPQHLRRPPQDRILGIRLPQAVDAGTLADAGTVEAVGEEVPAVAVDRSLAAQGHVRLPDAEEQMSALVVLGDRPVVLRTNVPAVVVRGILAALDGRARADVEVHIALEKERSGYVAARRDAHFAAAGGMGGVDGRLQGRRVLRRAIAPGAKVPNIVDAGASDRRRGDTAAEKRRREDQPTDHRSVQS